MLLVFPSQKAFVWVFRGGEAPVGCRRVHFHRFTHEFPRTSPNPTHRFCCRANLSNFGLVGPNTSLYLSSSKE